MCCRVTWGSVSILDYAVFLHLVNLSASKVNYFPLKFQVSNSRITNRQPNQGNSSVYFCLSVCLSDVA